MSGTTSRARLCGVGMAGLFFSRCSGDAFSIVMHGLFSGRRVSKILVTALFASSIDHLSHVLSVEGVPCICISSGVTNRRRLTCFNARSFSTKFVTTGLLADRVNGRPSVLVSQVVRGNGGSSGRKEGHGRNFLRCLGRGKFKKGLRRIRLGVTSSRCGFTGLSGVFCSGPQVRKTIVFGSAYCVLKGCLGRERLGGVGLMKCSLVSGGARLLSRKIVATLVTRHPRRRKCGNVGSLYGRLILGRGPRGMGLVPVSVLVGRGLGCCLGGGLWLGGARGRRQVV